MWFRLTRHLITRTTPEWVARRLLEQAGLEAVEEVSPDDPADFQRVRLVTMEVEDVLEDRVSLTYDHLVWYGVSC